MISPNDKILVGFENFLTNDAVQFINALAVGKTPSHGPRTGRPGFNDAKIVHHEITQRVFGKTTNAVTINHLVKSTGRYEHRSPRQ